MCGITYTIGDAIYRPAKTISLNHTIKLQKRVHMLLESRGYINKE
jgi:hypothetical protein